MRLHAWIMWQLWNTGCRLNTCRPHQGTIQIRIEYNNIKNIAHWLREWLKPHQAPNYRQDNPANATALFPDNVTRRRSMLMFNSTSPEITSNRERSMWNIALRRTCSPISGWNHVLTKGIKGYWDWWVLEPLRHHQPDIFPDWEGPPCRKDNEMDARDYRQG